MFDRNEFKALFRKWVEENNAASSKDALLFCKQLMPRKFLGQNSWLIDESLSWFLWLKERRIKIASSYESH
jgi:hypothetical protein